MKDLVLSQQIPYQNQNCLPLNIHFAQPQVSHGVEEATMWVNCVNSQDQKLMHIRKQNAKDGSLWILEGHHNTFTKKAAGSARCRVNMTSISSNDQLIAHASPLMQVSFQKLADFKKDWTNEPWWLTVGSQSVKTYREDPEYPGVNRITIT
jgi:hypothetical protein